jgi:hypothetical protein
MGHYHNDLSICFPDVLPPYQTGLLPAARNIMGTNYTWVLDDADYMWVDSNGAQFNSSDTVLVTGRARMYVTGNFTMQGGSSIIIAPDASLVLYVGGATSSLATINSAGNCFTFTYYGLPGNRNITFNDSGGFLGSIYAPSAALTVRSGGASGFDFQGSCAVDTVTVNGHFRLHYDENLYRLAGSPPWITIQPQSPAVTAGQPATFTVAATGTPPLSYQWRFKGNAVPNATDSDLTITNAGALNAGTYSVVVTNPWGSLMSSNASLTVNYPPSILGQPVSQAALLGSNVVLRVIATGQEPLAYQWKLNGADVAGATASFLPLSGVEPGDVGAYWVIVTNAFGSVTSSNALLSLATPPGFLWARGESNGAYGPYYGPPVGYSMPRGIAADSSGNVFVAGWSQAPTVDLGGAVLTNNVSTNVAAFPPTMEFICKYDASGNLLWSRQPVNLTLTGGPTPLGIGTDASGNVYCSGHFQGIASFGSNTLVNLGVADMFLAKYDPQGQALWARRIGAYDTNYWNAFGFAVDAAGNAYVASRDSGTADFGTVMLTNSAAFIAKYDPAGTLLWATESLPASAIAAGTNGAVYMTGPHILAQYDALGTLGWSRDFPIGRAIALDGQENIFVTGHGFGTYDGLTITNSNGDDDLFVARCTPAGQLVWLRQAGGIYLESGYGVALDNSKNVYVAGASGIGLAEPSLVFGATVLTNVVTFVAKYDEAGNALWAVAPTANDRAATFGIAVADPADVYVAGCFGSSASFGSFALQNPSPSSYEIFVAKLAGVEPAGPPVIAKQPQSQLSSIGSSATFAVTVPSGIPLACQWTFNGTNIIEGATNLSLTLPKVQLTDGGDYALVVGNVYGATTSAPVTLTVVGVQPQKLTVLTGQSAAFTLTANPPTPLLYQWRFGDTSIPDATEATFVLNGVGKDQAGCYLITVTNAAGQVASSAGTLVVSETPMGTLDSPLCAMGGQIQFNVTGVSGLSYVVEASTNLLDWEPLFTNTPPFLFVDQAATNSAQRFYRAVWAP